jgi:hypothetical protein
MKSAAIIATLAFSFNQLALAGPILDQNATISTAAGNTTEVTITL